MLRRKPTTLTLTTEDIAIYEDARNREAQQAYLLQQQQEQAHRLQQDQQQRGGNQNQSLRDPSDELRPIPGDRYRAQQAKSREERLGLGVGGNTGGGVGGSRS
jgi:hypothetical protein